MKKNTNLRSIVGLAVWAGCFIFAADALAQQIGVTTPFNNVSDSFYENHGINFGFSLPGGTGPESRVVGYGGNGIFSRNINFNQGGSNSAIPPFGGYDPNAGAHFGYATINPSGGGYSLAMNMGKGSSRSLVSSAPSVVVQNGYGGSISSGAFRPFVTGITPVVGEMDNAVTRALNSGQLDLRYSGEDEYQPESTADYTVESSAQFGDESVAAIKARREAQQRADLAEVQSLIEEGIAAEEAGNYREARIAYRSATSLSKDARQIKWLRERVTYLKGR